MLPPGGETPVKVLVTKPPAYARYETLHEPMKPYSFEGEGRPAMKFRGARLRKGRYGGYEVAGEIVKS